MPNDPILQSTRYHAGRAIVEVSSGLFDIARDMLDLTEEGGEIIGIIEKETREIFENALEHWPVKTGRSLKTLRMELEVEGESLSSSVVVGTSYAHLIKGKSIKAGGLGDEGHTQTWRVLLQRPLLERADRVVSEFANLLADK